MKTLYIFCLSSIITLSSFSQNSITAEKDLKLKNNFREQLLKRKRQQASNPSNNKAGNCDIDTLVYSQYKSTSTRFINLNSPNSASGYGQYFPVRDSVVILGFNIYAYAQTFFGSEQATVNIHFANSQKLPGGVPIVSEPVTIPWAFSTPLSNVKQTVMLSTPYTAFFGFVASIESATTSGINVATNNWDLKDGRNKGFSCAKFVNGWAIGSSVTVGSTTPPTYFDADIYIEPIVSYKIKSNFVSGDNSCLGTGESFVFENTSSPIMDEAYNPRIVDSVNKQSFDWDYGDGTPLDTIVHGAHTYSNTITLANVTLNSEFSGWTMSSSCKDTYVGQIVKPNLDAGFSTSINQGTLTLTDQSTDAEKWLWDFGDGSTDTIASPVHTYTLAGTYKVKQFVFSGGCLDSTITTIQILTTGINDLQQLGVKLYPNPVRDQLTIEFSDELANQLNNAVVELYTITGMRVNGFNVRNQADRLTIDLGSLNNGSYLLKVSNSNGSLIGRSVVVKE